MEDEQKQKATGPEAISALGAALAGPKRVSGKNSLIVVPDGYDIRSLEAYQETPDRIVATPSFSQPRYLIDYSKRYLDAASSIFCDANQNRVTVVLDWHSEGKSREDHTPSFGKHAPFYQAEFTEEWNAWASISQGADSGRGYMKQQAFIEFLEEHDEDISKPAAADVRELCMRFDAVEKNTFKSAQSLHDGNRELVYQTDTQTKGSIKVPEEIELRIAVFEGMEPIPVRVLFRYRISEGQIVFAVKIHRQERVVRDAFGRACEAIATELSEAKFYHGAR